MSVFKTFKTFRLCNQSFAKLKYQFNLQFQILNKNFEGVEPINSILVFQSLNVNQCEKMLSRLNHLIFQSFLFFFKFQNS